AVDNSEVDHLGHAAVIGSDHERRDTEDLGSGERVDVVAATVGFHQQAILGIMREQAQLDLRVVGGKKDVPRLSYEAGANFAAQPGGNREFLEVWGRRGKRPWGGPSWAKGGVHASGGSFNKEWQRIHVGRL